MNEWINKMQCIYTHTNIIHNETLISHKKEEILPFTTTQLNLQGTMLSQISQTEKDRYGMISITCGI